MNSYLSSYLGYTTCVISCFIAGCLVFEGTIDYMVWLSLSIVLISLFGFYIMLKYVIKLPNFERFLKELRLFNQIHRHELDEVFDDKNSQREIAKVIVKNGHMKIVWEDVNDD